MLNSSHNTELDALQGIQSTDLKTVDWTVSISFWSLTPKVSPFGFKNVYGNGWISFAICKMQNGISLTVNSF